MAVIRAARPTFRNPHDKLAFSVHAAFLASGFVLHATGPSASTDDALSSSSTGTFIFPIIEFEDMGILNFPFILEFLGFFVGWGWGVVGGLSG